MNVFILVYYLKKRLGRIGGRKILESVCKLCAASLAMCIMVYYCNVFWFNPSGPFFIKALQLLSCIVMGVLTFGIASRLMTNEEITFLLSMRKGKKIPKSE